MKNFKLLAIALFIVLSSTSIQAETEFSGTCIKWEQHEDYDVIWCASSNCICFMITDLNELVFPDLGVQGSGYGNPYELNPGVWKIPHE